MSLPTADMLRQARKSAGLTQEAVADALGIEQTTVSRYELGSILIPLDRLVALLDLYRVPTQDRGAFIAASESQGSQQEVA